VERYAATVELSTCIKYCIIMKTKTQIRKLTPEETHLLESLLERGLQHNQILISTNVKDDPFDAHATDEIASICDHGEVVIIGLAPRGLKFLWNKFNGK